MISAVQIQTVFGAMIRVPASLKLQLVDAWLAILAHNIALNLTLVLNAMERVLVIGVLQAANVLMK